MYTSSKISQREARSLRKRVAELESERKEMRGRWASEWSPKWTTIGSLTLTTEAFATVKTARLLNHAVIIVPSNSTANDTTVRMYAERMP